MAEPPSSQQDTDPAECDTVKKKPCSDGHSQMVPATLQLQVQSLRPTSEEKVDMIKKWSDEAYQLMQRINKGEYNKCFVNTAKDINIYLIGIVPVNYK